MTAVLSPALRSRRLARRLAVLGAALAALVVMLAPRPAAAFERQWHLGAGLGYGYLAANGSHHGFGGGVHATYGLSDAFNAMLELDLTDHPSADALVASGSLGVAYVFDVLQWVPYVGAMAGAYDVISLGPGCGGKTGVSCFASKLGVSFPVGLDYQLSRSFAVGGQARYHLLFLGQGGAESYLSVFARAEYVWGY